MSDPSPNRLIKEKSPYLLQHAYNPVDWYPWGVEAFQKATAEDKPIFLSIGYSTCHWCHVMEEESFKDPEVAMLMNDAFVSIKVDREERPDVDGVYMRVCQMLTGGGGWPLTIIMTPDKKPFWAGTYIPKQSRFNAVGLMDMIPQITEYWDSQRERLKTIGEGVIESLKVKTKPGDNKVDLGVLNTAILQLTDAYDERYGGFGSAPKFPTAHYLLFLLRYWKKTGMKASLRMVEKTLTEMRLGGVYDHVGYGFHRYSTDQRWLVPHFEKMLYDQAMLLMAYVEAYQVTGNRFYREVGEEIITYVLRDLGSPMGGFYSAEDADSEGEEGKFYVWRWGDLTDTLTPEQLQLVGDRFNAKPNGNYVDEATRKKTGANILYLTSQDHTDSRVMDKLRSTLFERRLKRVRPLLDDKVLTDWNGLMIAALAKAARAFNASEYLTEASRAAEFITGKMWDGVTLSHLYRGEASSHGFLDDYAFLVWGLLELYESSLEERYLKLAHEINQASLDRFWDREHNGFYFTVENQDIPVRRKDAYDGAIPSGNSVAMMNMLRLARITGDTELESKAFQVAQSFSISLEGNPMAHLFMVSALSYGFGPGTEIVIVGERGSAQVQEALRALGEQYLPNSVTVHRSPDLIEMAGYLEPLKPIGELTVYVCTNHTCNLPVTSVSEMLKLLNEDE